jgi:hypothetical protein
MRRRELLPVLAGATTLAHASRAQQKAMPVVGFLNSGSADILLPISISPRSVAGMQLWAMSRARVSR